MKQTTITTIVSFFAGILLAAAFHHFMPLAPKAKCIAVVENNGTMYCVTKNGATPLKQ